MRDTATEIPKRGGVLALSRKLMDGLPCYILRSRKQPASEVISSARTASVLSGGVPEGTQKVTGPR